MILLRHRSLGLLPEIIVAVALAMSVLTVGYTLIVVSSRDPVVLVPNAIGAGRLPPASADSDYVRGFACNFLADWATWNEHSYPFRKAAAIDMMTADVRPVFAALARQEGQLASSLAQSQSLTLTRVDIAEAPAAPRDHYVVTFAGQLRTFFGGVGGSQADPFEGTLLLRAKPPTPGHPLCLEVLGFSVARPRPDQESTP